MAYSWNSLMMVEVMECCQSLDIGHLEKGEGSPVEAHLFDPGT